MKFFYSDDLNEHIPKRPAKTKANHSLLFVLPGRYILINPNTTNGILEMIYRG